MPKRIQAESKISEARFFLEKMKEEFHDDLIFRYYYSAFLSSVRSITEYLKKEFPSSEMEASIKNLWRNDPELKYLKDARNEDIHRKPPGYVLTKQFRVSFSPTIDEQRERREKGQPYIPQMMHTGEHQTIARKLPQIDDIEVIEFCENQLTKLKQFISEWKKS